MEWDNIKLNKVRKALGLSLAEMGALLNMSGVSVHHVERGNYVLQPQYVDSLEKIYGLTPEKVTLLMDHYDAERSAVGDKERAIVKLKKVIK
ncbi:helix-turn-helix domain-containing protein [Piscibacillus sp. B03]|uniref:helix-turn-helix domain-containing protein n=1 Tax=Piscibacillus sp. B03 TaxID=3457430 RepID=UPI003FCEA0C1